MGVQIPRGVHSQVPQEGTLWGTEAASRRCVPQAGLAEGEPDRRRSSHVGSCSHDDLDPTEVRGFASGRLYQGQECDPPGPDVRREEAQLRGTAFLGQRLLRLDRRSGRSGDTGVHQEPGARQEGQNSWRRYDYRILKATRVGFFAGMPLPKDIAGLSPAELKSLVLRLLEK